MSTPKKDKDTRPLHDCYLPPQPMFTLCPTCRTLVLGHLVLQGGAWVWMGTPQNAALPGDHICPPPEDATGNQPCT
jgi:hypothetical protein